MGAFKKLSMELSRKHQIRLVAALDDFAGSTMKPCGCDDINNLCPNCEASYLQWMADCEDERQNDLTMLGG